MAAKLPQIPAIAGDIPPALVPILQAMKDLIEIKVSGQRNASENDKLATVSNVTAAIAAIPAASSPFPVGSIFIAAVSTNPATLLGYGTWSAFAAGRVLVGIDAGQAEFDTLEETGGAKTHMLSVAEMPAHTHDMGQLSLNSASGGTELLAEGVQQTGAVATDTAGGGGAHNNLQPYVVVHIWKRTA